MILSVTQLAQELADMNAWQATPTQITPAQYQDMIVHGIEKLYADTNRALEYEQIQYIKVDNEVFFNTELDIIQKNYIMICAQIEFLKKVQSDVNNIVGYTTNALTVTNADKPYANLKDAIGNYENERRIVYYKMVDYTLGE